MDLTYRNLEFVLNPGSASAALQAVLSPSSYSRPEIMVRGNGPYPSVYKLPGDIKANRNDMTKSSSFARMALQQAIKDANQQSDSLLERLVKPIVDQNTITHHAPFGDKGDSFLTYFSHDLEMPKQVITSETTGKKVLRWVGRFIRP